jgi:hypothetical protein
LKEGEINYVTDDLEFVSIVHALNMWSHYLMGRKNELRTNHIGLKYLFEQPTLNGISEYNGWIFISEYNFGIKHIKIK